jgi:RNA polymerase sigma factor (sigma-70 family)
LLYKTEKDISVLSALFLRYLDLSLGVCTKYLKDSEKAKDAVMDVFEQLPRKLRQHEIGNFRSWLYVVLKNHCLMQLRSSRNGKIIPLEDNYMQSAEAMHPDTDTREKEYELDKLRGCIENLTGTQKQSVTLFYLENKCYKDISAITGFDFNKVRSLIQNGKRNLKLCMESKENNTVKNE